MLGNRRFGENADFFFWLKLSGGLGQNGSNTKGNSGLGVYGAMFQPSALTVFLELCSLSHTKNL